MQCLAVMRQSHEQPPDSRLYRPVRMRQLSVTEVADESKLRSLIVGQDERRCTPSARGMQSPLQS